MPFPARWPEKQFKGQIILEPVAGNMGMIQPRPGFLKALRDICDREGILLIFDEVMTGFRVAKGGCQELFHVIPDLTTLGKVIGGGMPVGAYGGRKDVMESVSPVGAVYQAGTLSGNPIAMAAGLATLTELDKPGVYEDLSDNLSWLTNEFKDALGCDTKKFAAFFREMLINGVYMAPSAFEAGFISTAHSQEDLEKTAEAFKKSIVAE